MFEKLIDEFSWRRLFFIIIILLIVSGILYTFEWYSGYFRLSRIEKSINLLDKVSNLQQKELILKDKELSLIYGSIVKDLNAFINKPTIGIIVPAKVWQGVTGAGPWLLFILFSLPAAVRGDTSKKNAIVGFSIFAIFFGAIASILPAFQLSWINYIAYPVVTSGMVIFIIWIVYSRTKSA